MRWRRPLAWLLSLHAKLFVVVALVTSALTVMVAFSITRNSQRELEAYSRNVAIQTAFAVETEILARDPGFKDPRLIEQVLESMVTPQGSIFQIDVFKNEGREQISLVVSSLPDDDQVDWGPGLASYLKLTAPKPELVELNTGNRAWKVYLPIRNPRSGKAPIGLVRVYCDLERWETVWRNNVRRTLTTLPFVLLGEFIILWVILGTVVSDPLRTITAAMERLESGEAAARADVRRRDELGAIAERFNLMASRLEAAGEDKERLIGEIKGLNASLQDRIDEALSELQAKNQELEALMERNALLREELGQQDRLAIAGQLTAAFAHEVGTPLNLVNGHLQLIRSQTDLTEKTRERVETIHGQIQRVGDIVRRLLGHTRRPKVNAETLSLDELVRDLERLWAPNLGTHRVHFERDIPPGVRLQVDRKQMEQLFINLVNNAVDAMPEGGQIRLAVAPDDTAPANAPRWNFTLSDTGTGIPAEVISRVFKPMFTTKPEGKGTGLGLSIVREIVRAHGGEVRLESQEGQGTQVYFGLPGTPVSEA